MSGTGQANDTGTSNMAQENVRNCQHTNETFGHFLGSFSFLERFLLFMAKTELFVLQYCTRSTRMTLTSIGAMVVLTGILAFSSSFFAIKNSFFYEDTNWVAFVVPPLVASVYAAAIMAFDREIVSSSNKSGWLSVIRIIFAVLIGFVISFPIELQMQQGRIVAEIDKMAEARSQNKREDIKKINTDNSILLEEALKPLSEKKDSLSKLRDQERESMKWESVPEHGYCRGKCEEHRANAEEYQRQIDQLAVQIQQERNRIEGDKRFLENQASLKSIEADIEKDKKRSHDLLSQAVALHSIHNSPEEGGTATLLSWFLRLFFVCFELFPVLIKMTMPYTEYHAYQEARNRLIVYKLIGASNHKLQYFKDNPDKIQDDKTEITDMLVDLLEDREIDVNKHGDPAHV